MSADRTDASSSAAHSDQQTYYPERAGRTNPTDNGGQQTDASPGKSTGNDHPAGPGSRDGAGLSRRTHEEQSTRVDKIPAGTQSTGHAAGGNESGNKPTADATGTAESIKKAMTEQGSPLRPDLSKANEILNTGATWIEGRLKTTGHIATGAENQIQQVNDAAAKTVGEFEGKAKESTGEVIKVVNDTAGKTGETKEATTTGAGKLEAETLAKAWSWASAQLEHSSPTMMPKDGERNKLEYVQISSQDKATTSPKEQPITFVRTGPASPAERPQEKRVADGLVTPQEALRWFQTHKHPELHGTPKWDSGMHMWIFPDRVGDGGKIKSPESGTPKSPEPGGTTAPHAGASKVPECLPIPGTNTPEPRVSEFVADLHGQSLTDFERRTRAALDALQIQTQSPLAGVLVGTAAMAGERDPERLRNIAMVGYALEQFATVAGATSAARTQNASLSIERSSDAHVQAPIRTAQSVVQQRVDTVVREFHSNPTRLAEPGVLSPAEINTMTTAAHQYLVGAITEHDLRSAIGKAFGKAVERSTIASLQAEGAVSIGQRRDDRGRYTTSPDLLFQVGEFAGKEIEITTAQAWAEHYTREWGPNVDYALYQIEYPNLMRFLIPPR